MWSRLRFLFLLSIAVFALGCPDSCDDDATGPSGNFAVTCNASVSSPRTFETVTFTASSKDVDDPKQVHYSWSFGDGTAASGAQVPRAYERGGNYQVTVTATYGKSQVTCTTNVVVDSAIRIDSCRANPDSGVVPLDVGFSPLVHGGTGSYTYSWDLGDGTTSDLEKPNHTYTSKGSYTVRLTVRSGSETAECVTGVDVFDPMKVTCSADPLAGQAPLTVSFTSSAEGSSRSYSYEWDFEDGQTSKEQNPSHTYTIAAGFKPTVVVTGDGRQGECRTKLITVTGASGAGGGGGGGGGGGATPTPTTDTCPATLTLSSTTPFVTRGGGNGPEFVVSGYNDNCSVNSIEVSFYATTTTDLSIHSDPMVGFIRSGTEFIELLEPLSQGVALSGPSLGSSCGGLTFRAGAPSFTSATPPYDGVFAPYRDFSGFLNTRINGTWVLPFYRLDEPMTIQCWSLRFELEIR